MAASKFSNLSLDDENFVMVAAIDFGTTYSGYAFGFKSHPDDIRINHNWGEESGFQSYKTPTSVLTGPDHKFVAFGHEAEKKYSLLTTENGQHHMYKHFKMILHQKEHLTRKTTVTSTDGHIRPAMDIFVMSLEYLKNHLLEAVGKEVTSKLQAHLVRWVITVPAIWSEKAKNFMREAAYKAGCITSKDSRQLVICLEPEAASLYCRQLKTSSFCVAAGKDSLKFKTNTRYLVIDAGGGTIDITAHEVQFNGDLKELHLANGGSWGGTKVDENFIDLLKKILGADFLNAYKQQCPENWLTMMGTFETLKKSIKPDGASKIALPIVYSMASKYMKICKKDIEDAFNESSESGVSFNNGSVILNHKTTMLLFQPVIDHITTHIKSLMKLPALQQLSYVLLVGGFGESPVLQKAIQNILPSNTKLLVPSEAQLSVIKGAVNFGQNVNQISSRIARHTYGIDLGEEFVKGKHDNDRMFITERGEKCYVFTVLVKKGASIDIGCTVKQTSVPAKSDQTSVTHVIYATDSDNLEEVEYVDNPKFTKVGEVTVDSPNTEKGLDRKFELHLEFGGTEIRATAVDLTSGCTAETVFDIL